jgi:FMN phosphatase YigB (HAD superfamily)
LNWIHVGDDLANDVGAAALTGAKSIWFSTDEEESELPSWSTATKEELERRAKLNDSSMEHVSRKISNLTELESAVMHILTSEG